jgi:ABC-type transport system involved in cytochrome c biogenesis permease component
LGYNARMRDKLAHATLLLTTFAVGLGGDLSQIQALSPRTLKWIAIGLAIVTNVKLIVSRKRAPPDKKE